jgi:hypothetical protein
MIFLNEPEGIAAEKQPKPLGSAKLAICTGLESVL